MSVPVPIDSVATLFATHAGSVLQSGARLMLRPHCRVAVQQQDFLVWWPFCP